MKSASTTSQSKKSEDVAQTGMTGTIHHASKLNKVLLLPGMQKCVKRHQDKLITNISLPSTGPEKKPSFGKRISAAVSSLKKKMSSDSQSSESENEVSEKEAEYLKKLLQRDPSFKRFLEKSVLSGATTDDLQKLSRKTLGSLKPKTMTDSPLVESVAEYTKEAVCNVWKVCVPKSVKSITVTYKGVEVDITMSDSTLLCVSQNVLMTKAMDDIEMNDSVEVIAPFYLQYHGCQSFIDTCLYVNIQTVNDLVDYNEQWKNTLLSNKNVDWPHTLCIKRDTLDEQPGKGMHINIGNLLYLM